MPAGVYPGAKELRASEEGVAIVAWWSLRRHHEQKQGPLSGSGPPFL